MALVGSLCISESSSQPDCKLDKLRQRGLYARHLGGPLGMKRKSKRCGGAAVMIARMDDLAEEIITKVKESERMEHIGYLNRLLGRLDGD